jgi:hypothetical protein
LAGGNGGAVSNSFSAGNATGTSDVGGLVGYNSGMVSNSYYDKETNQNDDGKGFGKTTAEMQSKEFVDSLNYYAGILSNSSFPIKAWVYSAGEYPVLSDNAVLITSIDGFFASGKGTETNPYIVNTKKQLEDFSWLVNSGIGFSDKHIKLSTHIALNDTANWRNWKNYPPDYEWKPIGISSSFKGTFDGNGFTVSGIYGSGLFGVVDSSGNIKNLGVVASYIKGESRGGGLAEENYGLISYSYSLCVVTQRVVYSPGSGGGLVGTNGGIISNSYSISMVSGEWNVGGLAGSNYHGTINNSYSASIVESSSRSRVGGLTGFSWPGPINNSYYNKETCEEICEEIDDDGEEYYRGEGKTTTELKEKATYEGWDFDEIWGINRAINNGYPYLLVFK